MGTVNSYSYFLYLLLLLPFNLQMHYVTCYDRCGMLYHYRLKDSTDDSLNIRSTVIRKEFRNFTKEIEITYFRQKTKYLYAFC